MTVEPRARHSPTLRGRIRVVLRRGATALESPPVVAVYLPVPGSSDCFDPRMRISAVSIFKPPLRSLPGSRPQVRFRAGEKRLCTRRERAAARVRPSSSTEKSAGAVLPGSSARRSGRADPVASATTDAVCPSLPGPDPSALAAGADTVGSTGTCHGARIPYVSEQCCSSRRWPGRTGLRDHPPAANRRASNSFTLLTTQRRRSRRRAGHVERRRRRPGQARDQQSVQRSAAPERRLAARHAVEALVNRRPDPCASKSGAA